jgi:hypothetical protein
LRRNEGAVFHSLADYFFIEGFHAPYNGPVVSIFEYMVYDVASVLVEIDVLLVNLPKEIRHVGRKAGYFISFTRLFGAFGFAEVIE